MVCMDDIVVVEMALDSVCHNMVLDSICPLDSEPRHNTEAGWDMTDI